MVYEVSEIELDEILLHRTTRNDHIVYFGPANEGKQWVMFYDELSVTFGCKVPTTGYTAFRGMLHGEFTD